MSTLERLSRTLLRTQRGGAGCEHEGLKIISWNLLHTTGAVVEDVAKLIRSEQPDLVFMQEATTVIHNLPDLVGGHYYFQPSPGRRHGLAVWTSEGLESAHSLKLPVSRMPGGLPPRDAAEPQDRR